MNQGLARDRHGNQSGHRSVMAKGVVMRGFIFKPDEPDAVKGSEHVTAGIKKGQFTVRMFAVRRRLDQGLKIRRNVSERSPYWLTLEGTHEGPQSWKNAVILLEKIL